MSNNGLMTYKSKWLSFINKGEITLMLCLSLIVIIPCSYLMFMYWAEMPLMIKLLGPMLSALIFISIIITPLNGMIITKTGTILFFPDLRVKKFNVKDLKRISIIFNEWENNKYSVLVKFIYIEGKVFCKDYSKQFRNMKNKKLAMTMYTIPKRKVKTICDNLLDLNICVVTIIDKNRNIIYQSK